MGNGMGRIISPDFIFSVQDVFQGNGWIFHHIVQVHESRRPAHAGFTMKVQPGLGRQGLDKADELVYRFRPGPEVVCSRDAVIVKACSLHEFLFRLCPADEDGAYRKDGIVFSLLIQSDGLSFEVVKPIFFVLKDSVMAFAFITPVPRPVPADGDPIGKPMGFLTQVYNVHRSGCLFF